MNKFERYNASQIVSQETLLKKFNALIKYMKENPSINVYGAKVPYINGVYEYSITDIENLNHDIQVGDVIVFTNNYFGFVDAFGFKVHIRQDIHSYGTKGEKGDKGDKGDRGEIGYSHTIQFSIENDDISCTGLYEIITGSSEDVGEERFLAQFIDNVGKGVIALAQTNDDKLCMVLGFDFDIPFYIIYVFDTHTVYEYNTEDIVYEDEYKKEI